MGINQIKGKLNKLMRVISNFQYRKTLLKITNNSISLFDFTFI